MAKTTNKPIVVMRCQGWSAVSWRMLAYDAAYAGASVIETGEASALSGMRGVEDATGLLSEEELAALAGRAALLVCGEPCGDALWQDALVITAKTDYVTAREVLLRRLKDKRP
jgi:hypothetical protein